MQSRYGPGAKKEETKAAPDSEPIPGAEADEGEGEAMPLEAAPVPDGAPEAGGGALGAEASTDAVVEALRDVPPEILKAALAQLMPAEEGADDIDADLAARAGRMTSGMEG